MEARVKIENFTSETFSISSAVRQGDPLSATIFNLTLGSIIKKLSLRGVVSLKLNQMLLYYLDL